MKPRNIAAFVSAIAVIFALGTSTAFAQNQNAALREVDQLIKQGQLDKALDRVNAYLVTQPKEARGRFLKGLILTEQHKSAEAIKIFTALTQDYPELPEPYNNLAVLYASEGKYDKARDALEMAIRTHPSYATAHENLGDIYAKMASQAYDKALQIDRGNATAQTKLNLIKELFSSSQRPAKAAMAKAEPAPKPRAPVPAPVAKAPVPAPVTKAPAPAVVATPATPSPAPVVAAAAKPAATAKEPVKPAASHNADEVLKAVNAWADAWSSNDVPGYLAHYASTFKTPGGEPRGKWEAQRKKRIAKPRKIEVEVEAPKVKFKDDNRATVTFRQHYRSGSFKASGIKTLEMVKMGNKWLIQKEQVGS